MAQQQPPDLPFSLPPNYNRVNPANYNDYTYSCRCLFCCDCQSNCRDFFSCQIEFGQFCLYLFLVFLPTLFPLVLISLQLHEEKAILENALICYFLIFSIFLMFLGACLLFVTNTDSISGMVAQRFNKISYMTIIVIVGTSFYSSCFILSNGASSEDSGADVQHWYIICASLSPLVSTLILFFPLFIEKDAQELQIIPIGIPLNANNYSMRFFPRLDSKCHRVLHYLAIVGGLTLGYFTIIYNINTREYNRSYTFTLILCVASVIFSAAFFVSLFFQLTNANIQHQRYILYLEFLGLYSYMVLLIYISMESGNLI